MISNNKLYMCSNEGTTFDPSYRYITNAPNYEKQKKKGTDITYITNSANLAAYLHINHDLFVKLIGVELSCPYKLDSDRGCAVYRGNYTNTQINNILCTIIKNYYLCKSCDYPEIALCIKHKMLRQTCSACGKKYYVDEHLASTKTYSAIIKDLEK